MAEPKYLTLQGVTLIPGKFYSLAYETKDARDPRSLVGYTAAFGNMLYLGVDVTEPNHIVHVFSYTWLDITDENHPVVQIIYLHPLLVKLTHISLDPEAEHLTIKGINEESNGAN